MKLERASIQSAKPLRTYAAPWHGELVLVCTKCRRKLKKHKGAGALANLKKWFKKRSKADEDAPDFRIVGVDCVKMCPKGGVTVFTQHQIGNADGPISILRSEADLESLYANLPRTHSES